MARESGEISFEAAVQRVGDRLILRLPEAASRELPSRGQVAVTGTLNGDPLETVLEPDGLRGHWIALDERPGSELGAGDTARLELRVADAWPEPAVPDDLREALRGAPEVAQLWADITPMARWEWVRWVRATKNPQTRARRVEVTISKLDDGKRRPCCFDLSSCTDPELSKSGKLAV